VIVGRTHFSNIGTLFFVSCVCLSDSIIENNPDDLIVSENGSKGLKWNE
jgi:hypothetical protein